jgi:hypothetical protein
MQALHPGELVVELGAGLRIAVGQVETADQDAVHRRLDIAGLLIARVAGQRAAGLDRPAAAGEQCDAMPARHPDPDRAVAGSLDRGLGELLLRGLQFLQAGDVRLRLLQPFEQAGQAAVDAVTL